MEKIVKLDGENEKITQESDSSSFDSCSADQLFQELSKRQQRIEKQSKNLGKQIQETKQKHQELEEQIQKHQELGKQIENIKEKLEGSQTQYITILGIFASIILAFVGAFTFSTSIFKHMHEVSFYRLSFVILCIALLIVNILQGLFDFLRSIHDKKYEKKCRLFTWFNISILFAMFCIFIHYSIRESYPIDQIKLHISWLAWLFV